MGGGGGLQAYPPPHPPPRFPHQRQTSISRALEDLSSPPQPLLSPISSLPSDCRAARPVAIIARSEQWRPLRHRVHEAAPSWTTALCCVSLIVPRFASHVIMLLPPLPAEAPTPDRQCLNRPPQSGLEWFSSL